LIGISAAGKSWRKLGRSIVFSLLSARRRT
jgi:hypothetical protein